MVFPTTLETLTRGRSLGKLALGLRTVRDDAGPISSQHAFIRALIGFVEIYVFGGAPAFFSALISPRGKRLGDFAAGTYVVRERVRLAARPPATMPPHLAAWAARADMTSLPTGLALAVRQFLGRLPTIDPTRGSTIGARLADEVLTYVAPEPPPRTAPEDFLAAVIAYAVSGTWLDWSARRRCATAWSIVDEPASGGDDVVLAQEHLVGGRPERDEGVGAGDPGDAAAVTAVDEGRDDGLGDAAAAPGLVDDQDRARTAGRRSLSASSGSGASQRRSSTVAPTPRAGEDRPPPAG